LKRQIERLRNEHSKSNKRLIVETITKETKGKAKKRPKHAKPARTKKRERVSPTHGRK
jgi:hypothetical protein